MSRFRAATMGLFVSLLVTGCADRTVRKPLPHSAHHAPAAARAPDDAGKDGSGRPLPNRTGIAACDDYLASYRACHRAAGIFTPDQIEPRYQEMRQSLLRDAQDPNIRPQLALRCNSLARSLRQALHGKSCSPPTSDSGRASP
jgi:hypothetical protein